MAGEIVETRTTREGNFDVLWDVVPPDGVIRDVEAKELLVHRVQEARRLLMKLSARKGYEDGVTAIRVADHLGIGLEETLRLLRHMYGNGLVVPNEIAGTWRLEDS